MESGLLRDVVEERDTQVLMRSHFRKRELAHYIVYTCSLYYPFTRKHASFYQFSNGPSVLGTRRLFGRDRILSYPCHGN